MKYKGYEAMVEFDEADRLFVGRVINTRDVIAFDGASVAELEQSFHQVIDEYLEDCQTVGKTPEKPFSGRFNLRISPILHRHLVALAQEKEVSLNAFVERVLESKILLEAAKGSPSAQQFVEQEERGVSAEPTVGKRS